MFSFHTFRIRLIFNIKQNVGGHLISICVSVSRTLSVMLEIECHCFDTIAQTEKWFLKGDRAISLLLELWGWRRTCLSVRTKKEVMTGSHTTFQNSALILTRKHIHPPGEKQKLPEGTQTFMWTMGIFSDGSKAVTKGQWYRSWELTQASNVRLHDGFVNA